MGLLALLAFWTWRFATHPLDQFIVGGSFMHLINLPFHEAGHIFFSVFGPFMMSLGGSLTQVLVPLICAVAFVRRPDAFAAAVAIWWAGQNLVDLAPYIADARALQLVLLGGATGAEVEGHDWEAILTALGWLHRDRQLGITAHVVGSVTMAVSVVVAGWITWRDYRGPDSDTTGYDPGRNRIGPRSQRYPSAVRTGSERATRSARTGSESAGNAVRAGSEPGTTGVRTGSEPGASSVRTGSQEGTSAVRTGSERGQNGVRTGSE